VIEDNDVFEQLRLLLNFQLEDRFLFTLLLFGQPELADKVANLKQFEQRVAIRCHLDKLDLDHTKSYIIHRLKIAGRDDKVFGDDAVKFIFERSGGIPRRVNRICDLSLLNGFAKKAKTVDKDLVKSVVEDFKL